MTNQEMAALLEDRRQDAESLVRRARRRGDADEVAYWGGIANAFRYSRDLVRTSLDPAVGSPT